MQAKGGSFAKDKDFFRFTLGRGQVIPAFEEAVLSMKEGGIRRIVVPVELGYPNNDMNALGPSPTTFSVWPPLLQCPRATKAVTCKLSVPGHTTRCAAQGRVGVAAVTGRISRLRPGHSSLGGALWSASRFSATQDPLSGACMCSAGPARAGLRPAEPGPHRQDPHV